MRNVLFIIILFSTFTQAQINPKTKWGNVSQAEIDYKEVPYEKSADAVILYESGNLLVAYENWGNKIYKRIKILSEKGKELANYDLIYFTLYGYESISNLRAQTINFENGKKIITPVKFKEIYDLPYSGYYRTRRFAFPNVKVGSIIELEYDLVNSFHYYMEGWVFQHKIPTLYSSFSVDVQIPADYVPILSGERIIAKARETKNKKEYKTTWTLTDLPSLENTTFLYNPRDFEERIDFQLKGYYHKKGHYVNEVRTWADIRQDYMMVYLKKYDEKTVSNISKRILTATDPNTQAQNTLDYFRKNFQWNEITNVLPRQNFTEIDLHKKGSSSELNLLLNYVLNKKNIDAKLVLIGNRNHRKIQIAYPYFNQFSSLINLINLPDGTSYFVDASQIPDFSYTYMPLRNYNHFGLAISDQKEEFIAVTPPLSEFHTTQNFVFKDGKFYMTKMDKKSGYFLDNEISKNMQPKLAIDIDFPDIQNNLNNLIDYPYLSSKSTAKSSQESLNLYQIQNPIESILKKLILNEAERKKPIEFDFPFYYKNIISVKIPEGYSVQIPENFNTHHMVGNQDLIYYQNAEIQNGILIYSIEFVLNKIIFTDLYPTVKTFFDQSNLDASKTILIKKN